MQTSKNYVFPALCILSLFLQACSSSFTNSTAPDDKISVALPVSQGIENGYQAFKSLSFHKGDRVPDLTLFSVDGQSFTLNQALKTHKPLMLISGSYTCDASRHNLPAINALARHYQGKLNIYMVYIIDAHPSDTISPYSARHQRWLAKANIEEHVEANQPRTYGQRKALARKWQKQYKIEPPVLVDTPDNSFWINFGQAPNMIYLLEPDGKVFFQEEWYQPKEVEQAVAHLVHTD